MNYLQYIEYLEKGNAIGTVSQNKLRNLFNAHFTQEQVDNINKFYKHFHDKGWSDRNIFGLMGNIFQESRFYPAIDNNGAYRYYQFKDDRRKDYNEWIIDNSYKDGGLSQTEYLEYIIANAIDPRWKDYLRAKELAQSSNAVDRKNGQEYLTKIQPQIDTGTFYPVKDLTEVWSDDTTSLDDFVDLFAHTIERAKPSEINLENRRKYANLFKRAFTE